MRPAASLLLPALLALSAPAGAQTPVEAYARAQAAFQLPGLTRDPLEQRQALADTLASLEGRWFSASALADFGPALPADLFARACDRAPAILTAETPYRFVLTRTGPDGDFATAYAHVAGQTFQPSGDDAAYAAFLGLPEGNLDLAARIVVEPARWSPVQLFHPEPDVLVLAASAQPPEIWLRCP